MTFPQTARRLTERKRLELRADAAWQDYERSVRRLRALEANPAADTELRRDQAHLTIRCWERLTKAMVEMDRPTPSGLIDERNNLAMEMAALWIAWMVVGLLVGEVAIWMVVSGGFVLALYSASFVRRCGLHCERRLGR